MSITSVSKRQLHLQGSETPDNIGPGSYDPHVKDLKSRSAISREIPFGSTTRRELFNAPEREDIGPGTYEPQLIVKGAAPKHDFALSSKREYFIDYEKTPSPAEYSTLSNWVKGRSTEAQVWLHPNKIRPVSSCETRKGPTGLGNTEIDRKLETKESNFGREVIEYEAPKSRARTVREATSPKVRPGTRAADFCRSRSPQREPVVSNGIPGPGEYESAPHMGVRKGKSPVFYPGSKEAVFSIQKNSNETMVSHVPWCDVEQMKHAFGSGTRRELQFVIPDTPGVGEYEVNASQKKQVSKRSGFGTNRPDERSKTPGPGYYNIAKDDKNLYGNGERSKRGELWKIIDTPPPNVYDVDQKDMIPKKNIMRRGSPAFKDKSSRYNLENPEPNPGPAYNTRTKTKAKTAFSKAARFTPDSYAGAKINQDPGPADYLIGENGKARGGALSRNAHHDPDDNKVPGPGRYYHLKSELEKPSYNVMFNPSIQKVKPYH